jgi:UDP-N-acetylglucosamine 2-epimerase (non-hydrolysing)
MAPVIVRMKAMPDVFDVVVAVTAQHRDMLDQALSAFAIAPDHDLDIMRAGQSLTDVAVRTLRGVTGLLERILPDVVVVQGDTTTAMSAALAAFHMRIPVAHVEAGLRTNNLSQPFPEEANRRLIAQIAHWHFAPTALSASNLVCEGVGEGSIHVTGNTVVDALLLIADRQYEFPPGPIADVVRGTDRIVLVTAHRRENWGPPFGRICAAVGGIARSREDVRVLFATHGNPTLAATARATLGTEPRVHLVGPQEYLPFVKLMMAATVIISDSGGIQEEASTLGRPTLVMREVTERLEAVDAGVARLVGTDTNRIVSQALLLLDRRETHTHTAISPSPFGDGHAAERIAEVLARELGPG